MFDEEIKNTGIKNLKSKIIGGVSLAVLALIGLDSYGVVNAGYYHIVQNSLTGSLTAQMDEGIYARVPVWNKTTEYKRVFTSVFDTEDTGSSSDLDPIPVQFADTYSATIPATFRFRLPSDPEKMLLLHREFRTFDNLIQSLVVKNAKNVTVVTATQYTGERFFQGGINSFKNKLEDQLMNGLYQTERKQVVVEEAGTAALSVENSDVNKVEMQTRLVWKNVITLDKNGMPKRIRNPLAVYGLEVTQVTIDKPIPEQRLDNLLNTKKDLVAARISAEQEIITARAQAKSAAQKAEIEKQRAIQNAQKNKDLAVIAEKQKVDMERQKAQLAIVRKEKELKMAIADRDIQEAQAVAAKFSAVKIEAIGLAEARVTRAKLAAKESSKVIYMAELELDMAKVIYPNLQNINIDMPDYYVNGVGKDGNAPTSLDIMTTLGSMTMLKSKSSSLGQ